MSPIPGPLRLAKTGGSDLPAGELCWRTLHAVALDLLGVLDLADGRIVDVNEAVGRILGHDPVELRGRPFLELVHPDDVGAVVAILERDLPSRGRIEGFVCRCLHRDGGHRWLHWNGELDGEGRLVYAVGRDVTRERGEAAERDRRRILLGRGLEMARAGQFDLDLATGRWTSDPTLDSILGIDEAYERTVEGWARLVHPDDRERMVAALHASLAPGGEPFDGVYRIVAADSGEARWVRGFGQLAESDDGGGGRYFGLIQDITDQRRREEELEEREARYRLLAENVTDLISKHAPDGTYTFVSGACERLLGYEPGELLGRNGYDLFHPDDLAAIRGAAAVSRAASGVPTFTYRILRKDGSWTWFETTSRALRDEEGRVREILAVSRDVSTRRAMEAEVARRRADLEEAQRIGRTASWIHDPGSGGLDGIHELEGIRGRGSPPVAIDARSRRRLRAAMEAAVRDGDPFDLELRGARADGTEGWIRIIGRPESSRGRCGHRVRGVSQEITDLKRTQLRLAASEERFRTLVENAGEVVLELTPDARISYVSPSWADLMGEPAEEGLGRSLQEYVIPEDVPRCLGYLAARAAGEPVDRGIEYRVRRADGAVRWNRATGSVLYDGEGDVRCFIGVVRDETEEQLAREELRRRLAYEQALTSVSTRLLTSPTGHDDRLEEALGVLLEAARADRAYLFRNERNGEGRLCATQTHEVCASGVTPQIDNPDLQRMPYAGGFERWLEIFRRGGRIMGRVEDFPELGHLGDQDITALLALPVYVGGELTGFFGLDRTRGTELWSDPEVDMLRVAANILGAAGERRLAHRELSAREARFRALVEEIGDAIYVCDPRGRLLDANPAATSMTGRSREELLSLHVWDLEEGRTPSEVREGLSRLAPGEGRTLEVRQRHREGGTFPAEVRIRCFATEEGPRFISTVRDIRARQEAEARRLELERRVAEAQRAESLGVLAGGIAHDFNNLLAGVLGNVELARGRVGGSDEIRELLDEMDAAASRAADLARQMLAYSGKGRFQVGPTRLTELVEETATMLRSSLGSGVELHLELDPATPPVMADPTQLRQVAMNLIINAAEATAGRPGKVTVRVGVRDYGAGELAEPAAGDPLAPGPWVTLEVEDDGGGIEPEVASRIFEPFFSTKFTGRGLGLAAVGGIVRGHRGAIHLETAVGQGSLFRVLLPATQEGGPRVEAGVPDPAAPMEVTGGRVLVVDDMAEVRSVAARMLGRLGYEVVVASGGEEALRHVRDDGDGIVCVLLDVSMPGLDGPATLARLRERAPNLRVVMMSGYDEEEMAPHAENGAAGFVQKPFRIEALRDAVRGNAGEGSLPGITTRD